MARSQTTSTLLWKNVGWDGDCLTLMYETSKTNQTGEHVVPRHLYANPYEPHLCPVLAMGIKLLTESHTKSSPAMLFPGGSANKNFCTWLYGLIKSPNSEIDMSNLGSSPDDIGTHSIRKGAATYVCGLTDGPQSGTIKLRMDHTLGKVDDMYLYIQSGADKFVGRCASCLNMNNLDFNVLPLLFIDMEDVDFDAVLPPGNIKNASQSLKMAIPFLIASVVYHWGWIKQNLPWNHKIFSSKFSCGNFGELWCSKVKLSIGKCPSTGLTVSGTPKTSQLAFQLHDISEKLSNNHEATKEAISDLVEKVVEGVVRQIGSVDGVTLTNEDMTKRVCKNEMQEIQTALMKRFDELAVDLRPYKLVRSDSPRVDLDPITQNSFDQSSFQCFQWGGKFHYVPEDFMVPQDTPMAMWRLWIYGDLSKKIRPFRFIQGYSLSRSQQCQYSKLKKVMETVVALMQKSYDELAVMDRQICETLFFENYSSIVGDLRNIDRLSTSTAYEIIRKKDSSPTAQSDQQSPEPQKSPKTRKKSPEPQKKKLKKSH